MDPLFEIRATIIASVSNPPNLRAFLPPCQDQLEMELEYKTVYAKLRQSVLMRGRADHAPQMPLRGHLLHKKLYYSQGLID